MKEEKEKENFFGKREERKQTEEQRAKEASGFIKKLKMEKKLREKSQFKHNKYDDEYIQKIEEMMLQRKAKEVNYQN